MTDRYRELPRYTIRYRMAVEALFTLGHFRYQCPVMAQGHLYRLHEKSGNGFLYCKRAILECRWAWGVVPPKVMLGTKVFVIGEAATFAWGQRFLVDQAVVFQSASDYHAVRDRILDGLRDRIRPVDTYVPRPAVIGEGPEGEKGDDGGVA